MVIYKYQMNRSDIDMTNHVKYVKGNYQYYDKNGTRIKSGMYLKHDDGDIDYVHQGIGDLGFKANKGEICTEIYPLHQFDLDEWEIVDPQ